MWELLNEIGQTLRHNKLRTALTGFAVAWGIFMLIVLLGMGRGVRNAFLAQNDSDNKLMVTLWGGWTTKPYKGHKEWRHIQIKDTDAGVLKHDISNVDRVTATATLDSAKFYTNKDFISDEVRGVTPAEEATYKQELIAGRMLNEQDMAQERKVVVLSKENAELLFGSAQEAVGKRVTGMGLSWLVVGVYKHRWQKESHVPFSTAMTLNGFNGNVDGLSVKAKALDNLEEGEELEEAIRKSLARAHEFDPKDESAVYVWNKFQGYMTGMMVNRTLNIAIWVIGILMLLSGIVGVSNIMFVSVRERTHEIGIRRALGAKPRIIWTQIVLESVAVTALFGYIGLFFGMCVMQGIDAMFGSSDFLRNPTVDISIAIEVTLVLIAAGAIAGLAPAMRATKVKPVEALRDE